MRDKIIQSKILYAEKQYQELLGKLFDAKIEENKLEHISEMVADILGNSTKCFDYCAQDIFEKYILKKISNKKIKVYFPFYQDQLKKYFKELKELNNDLFLSLETLTHNMENNSIIPNTIIPYSIPREARQMVNADKHIEIIEIKRSGLERMARGKIGKIILMEPITNIQVFPDDKDKIEKIVIGYKMAIYNIEVGTFCLYAIQSTKFILDKLYRDFFESKILN